MPEQKTEFKKSGRTKPEVLAKKAVVFGRTIYNVEHQLQKWPAGNFNGREYPEGQKEVIAITKNKGSSFSFINISVDEMPEILKAIDEVSSIVPEDIAPELADVPAESDEVQQ